MKTNKKEETLDIPFTIPFTRQDAYKIAFEITREKKLAAKKVADGYLVNIYEEIRKAAGKGLFTYDIPYDTYTPVYAAIADDLVAKNFTVVYKENPNLIVVGWC